MPNAIRFIVALALLAPGCAAMTARQEFAPGDFGLAYLQPQSRAELPTLPGRALQAELANFDKAMGRIDAAARAVPDGGGGKLKAQAQAMRGLADGGYRAKLAQRFAQAGPGLADRIMAHARLGALGYTPIPKAPGEDADTKTANLAIAEADAALRAAEKAMAGAELARNMANMAGADLVDAQDTQEASAAAVTAFAAIATGRLAVEALADATAAEAKLAAAEKRLVAAAANPVVAMRTGTAAGRVANAHAALAAVGRDVPGHLEAAAKVLAAAKALK